MEPSRVLNVRKIAKKVKTNDKNIKKQIAEELNEIAKIIIDLHYSRKRKENHETDSDSLHESIV